MVVMTPSDEDETWKMLNTGFFHQGPAAIRYPRGSGPGSEIIKDSNSIQLGKGKIVRDSSKSELSIMSFGSCLKQAKQVGDSFDAIISDMRFVKPLDKELIIEQANKSKLIVTIEENVIAGGAGSAVAELLNLNNINTPIIHIGLPDKFIDHGDVEQQKIKYGLDVDSISKQIKSRLNLI